MLAHRLRRWPNLKPTLSQSLVFTGQILTSKVDPRTERVNTLLFVYNSRLFVSGPANFHGLCLF